jgi:benzaldehyde dehydrogenase (NAD)
VSRRGSNPASATSTAPTVHDEAQMPFGGVKNSRLWPVRRASAGIEAFTELRWLTLQTTPRHYPF